MKAGIAKRSITPPVGVDLTGYIGRPGPSARIHDDLYAMVAVLDDGATRTAIVTLDILGTNFEQDAALRKGISEATGIPQDNILIGSSHTHAGPAIQQLRHCGTPDDTYLRWAFSRVKAAATEANADLSDASLSLVRAKSNMGFNRRNWVIEAKKQASPTSGVITDPEIAALYVKTESGKSALLFNYACHGTVMRGNNVEVSADWIGAAKSMIEAEAGVTAGFLQGCCGNINPSPQGSFEEVKRAGEMVARPILDALADASEIDAPTLKIAWKTVDLPYIPMPPQEEVEMDISFRRDEIDKLRAQGAQKISIDISRAFLWWSEDILKTWESGGGAESATIRLQAMTLGGVTLIAIPGEVFCEFGLAIRKMIDEPVMVVGYANGNIGYVPTAEAYSEGGYEVCDAYKYYGIKMIGPESEGIIMDAVKSLIAKVR